MNFECSEAEANDSVPVYTWTEIVGLRRVFRRARTHFLSRMETQILLYSRTRHLNLLGGMSRERAGDDDGVVVVVELRETVGVTVVGARVDDEVTALVAASV